MRRWRNVGSGKHEMLAQRWFTVGSPSTTLAQQQTNVEPTSHFLLDGYADVCSDQ